MIDLLIALDSHMARLGGFGLILCLFFGVISIFANKKTQTIIAKCLLCITILSIILIVLSINYHDIIDNFKLVQERKVQIYEQKIKSHIEYVERKKSAAQRLGYKYEDVGNSSRYGSLIYSDTTNLVKLESLRDYYKGLLEQ